VIIEPLQNWNLERPREGKNPIGGSDEVVCKHLTGEIELVMLVDQEHGTRVNYIHVCAGYIPLAQVGYIIVLINAYLKTSVRCILFYPL
jgi:hypothetical protein